MKKQLKHQGFDPVFAVFGGILIEKERMFRGRFDRGFGENKRKIKVLTGVLV